MKLEIKRCRNLKLSKVSKLVTDFINSDPTHIDIANYLHNNFSNEDFYEVIIIMMIIVI